MKIINNYFFSLILFVATCLYSGFAFSKGYDYCSKKGEIISIISIIPKNFTKKKKDKLIDSLVKLKKNISPGDMVKLSIAKKDSINDVFEKCFPGCPTGEKWYEQMFGIGRDCNTEVMIADKRIFDLELITQFRKIYRYKELNEDGVTDIFSSLVAISEYTNNNYKETYILHSMNPFQSSTFSKKELDSLYLKVIQEKKMPKKWPNAKYIAITPNSTLINFWKDLFKINKQNFIHK